MTLSALATPDGSSAHDGAAVLLEAEATLPTRHGSFRAVVFRDPSAPDKEHIALVRGDVHGDDVLVRVHSECLTSEVLGSLKCDCAQQLEHAQRRIASEGRGVVLYLRQEGRGIGLANKIRAYALQAAGHDTVDANRLLGLSDDARSYAVAAALLRSLGVLGVRLLTNNPLKVDALVRYGVPVRARIPSVVPHHAEASRYLETKRVRMQHALPIHANPLEEDAHGTARESA
jgi:GTP cyclohydrolase II